MTVGDRNGLRRRWPEWLRWSACFVVVLGVHATAAATLLQWQRPDEPAAGGPAVLIDLAPVAAAPETPESKAAPGPQQVQAPPDLAPTAEDDPKAEPDKPQVATIEPPREEPPPEKVEPPAPPVETPLPETPPLMADVVLPPPRPPQPHAEPKRHRRVADLNSTPPKMEHVAPRAVAPAPGAASHDPNAIPNWKSELVSRLQRLKRYPSEAQERGVEGIAQLAFSVDRGGGVHNARIVRSSGSSVLDRAALDLVARAAPLPAPPPEMHGALIPIIVPMNYTLRSAH